MSVLDEIKKTASISKDVLLAEVALDTAVSPYNKESAFYDAVKAHAKLCVFNMLSDVEVDLVGKGGVYTAILKNTSTGREVSEPLDFSKAFANFSNGEKVHVGKLVADAFDDEVSRTRMSALGDFYGNDYWEGEVSFKKHRSSALLKEEPQEPEL